MKIKIFLSLILCFSISSFAQIQRNYAQELVDLLHQEKYFEAKEFKAQYAKQLPQNDKALDLLYNIHMSLGFNKPDSTIVYMEEFLGNSDYVRLLGPVVASYYSRLSGVYEDKQQYEKSISTIERHIDYLERNPYSMDQGFIKNEINGAQTKISSLKEKADNEPRIRIKRDSDICNLKLKDDLYIRFDVKYNNDSLVETWFDTGVTHHMVTSKEMAQKMGVKVVRNNTESGLIINGVQKNGFEGVLDSLHLGNIKLYNIPILVLDRISISHQHDSMPSAEDAYVERVFTDNQIIMGLPTMKLIGKFEFDRTKRTVSFPERTGETDPKSQSNMYFIRNTPYIKLNINDLNYIGFFDTGSNDFINLTFAFYERNKNKIQIDTSINDKKMESFHHSLTRTGINIPFEVVKDAKLYFDNQYVEYKQKPIRVMDRAEAVNILDGIVGVDFVKELGSNITFDFDAMTLKGKD